MSFEWQTEEDYNWNEELAPPEPPKRKPRRWPWLLFVGVVLLGTAVSLLYRQLNQRVETATDDIAADLVASYAVLQQAAAKQDENLFSSLLSGREMEWSLAQRANLNAGLLFDRPGFGLEWQPGLVETAVISQTFSPELNAAELTTRQSYSLDIGNGLTQSVQLERVDVYRLGEDRWLLAPPERDFWGVRRRLEGQIVSVRYPARDEQIVHRLAAELEAKLVQLCATPDVACPPDMRVRLEFLSDPESLGSAIFINALTDNGDAAQGEILNGEQIVYLVTPSLVGLPRDETGYQALFRGYARQMLLAAINDVTGWECCENVPFYRAAVTRLLYELGVGQWPLAADVARPTAVSLPNDFTLGNGALYWNAPFPETPTDFAQAPAPYVIIDFLTGDLHLSSNQIATSLVGSGTILMGQWLTELSDHPWTDATLNLAFREYVREWQENPAAIQEPESGLMLLCQNSFGTESGLYYYDYSLEVPLLVESVSSEETLYFTGLPDGSGIAVASLPAEGQPETYLLRNGEPRIEVSWNSVAGVTARPPVAIPTTTDPNGRYLLWTVTQGFTSGTFYALTDLAACQAGGSCEAIPVGGYPIWSPNAQQLITLTTTNPWWSEGLGNGLMLLRDHPTSEALNSPGFGSSVFWLNDQRFGYLVQFQNGQQQVVLADNNLGRPELLLDTATLRELSTGAALPASLRIQFAQPLATEQDTFLILASAANGDGDLYLLLYSPADGKLTPLSQHNLVARAVEIGVRISADGRFILFMFPQTDETDARLLLYDVSGQRVFDYPLQGSTPFPRHFYASWSPDGQWLAVPELGSLRLWHDGWDERLLTFDNLSCTNAAWVNKLAP